MANGLQITRPMQKRFLKLGKRFSLTKRQQFVTVTLLLTMGLLLTQLVAHELRYPMVAFLFGMSFFLSAFAMRDGLKGIEWITLLTLPATFTAAMALFYFLLPVRWLTRIPVVLFYGVGMYALLLTENIYNVAAERSIALLRAAHTIGFLLTLVTYFLLIQTILAFRFNAFVNAGIIGVLSMVLIFQVLWSMELSEKVSSRLWTIVASLTVVFTQISWVFSFWPVQPTIQALFLTTCFYTIVGMAQQYLVERLYRKNVIEFFVVTLVVFALVIFATNWRGT